MAESVKEAVYKLVKLVASPLRFFAVALLLLAGIIIFLAWKSTLPAEVTANLIYLAFAVFILLLLLVCILVIAFPKKLTFDQEAHLTVLRERLGDHELSVTYFSGTIPVVEPKVALDDAKKSV